MTCWAQSFTRPNTSSTVHRVKGPLMSTFQEISVACFPNAQSHVAVEVFKGNFWVIVMSSRRQQRCGCSLHGAQLSTGTCRSRSWLYGVALSDGMHAVPPCLPPYVLSYNERRLAMALYILKTLYERNSLISELFIFSSSCRWTTDLDVFLNGSVNILLHHTRCMRLSVSESYRKGSNTAGWIPTSERCETSGITKWFYYPTSTSGEAQWQLNYIMPGALLEDFQILTNLKNVGDHWLDDSFNRFLRLKERFLIFQVCFK